MVRTSKQLAAAATLLVAIAALGAGEAATPTLELRAEASILGGAVHLRQVARWSVTDNGYFRDLADVTIARFEPGQRELTLDLAAIRTVLEGAGVAGGEMTFRGPVKVVVRRLDADAEYARKPQEVEPKDLNEFLDRAPATRPSSPADAAFDAALGAASSASEIPALPVVVGTSTLRSALARHLADRLGIAVEDLELSFPGDHDRVLNLQEPAYSWKISTFGSAKLGSVTWRVTLSNGTKTRQVSIAGQARMWQQQLRCVRPLVADQVVLADDVETRRVLVDRLPEESPVGADVALKMQVVRAVAPGATITMRMLKPVMLVQQGQLVTVIAEQGGITMRSVGQAKESGAYGQAIRVAVGQGRDEVVLRVTVTGPQEARTTVPAREGGVAAAGFDGAVAKGAE